MENKISPQKVFAFIILAFFAIIAITIGRYVASNVAEERALEDALLEIEEPEEQSQPIDIGLPIVSAQQAKQQLRTLYVDIRTKEDYDVSHIRGSVHITNFSPEKYQQIERIVLVHKGNGDEQSNERLLSLVKSIPDKYDTKVLDGGYPSWILSDGPVINKPDSDNITDVAKMNPEEPRDIAPLIEAPEWENRIMIIDTRNPLAFKKSHVPGAINIPFGDLEEKRADISLTKQIYVYGNTDRETFDSSVRLFDLGFVETKTIRGGFNAWQEFGYPTTRSDEDQR